MTIGRGEVGTEECQQIALALATKCDAEFLEAVLDYKCAMDRFGGELYIGTYRAKLDDEGNRLDPKGQEPGTWETLAYLCHYESVAKATREATGSEKERDDKIDKPRPLPEPLPEPSPNGNEPQTAEV